MKNFIDTLKNIWKIEELRGRILTTLGFLLIYRLGSFVALPGIDPQQLGALQNQTSDGLLGLLNMFTGGAFSQARVVGVRGLRPPTGVASSSSFGLGSPPWLVRSGGLLGGQGHRATSSRSDGAHPGA